MKPAAGERWVALILGTLWVLCVTASAVTIGRATGFPPFFVASGARPADPPVLTQFRPTLFGGSAGDLRLGDHILRVGNTDVRGTGAATFFIAFVAQTPTGRPIEVEYKREGIRALTTVVPSSTRLFVPLLLAAPAFAVVAVLLWRRAHNNAAARAFVLALTNLAFYLASNFGGAPFLTCVAMALHVLTVTLIGPLIIQAFLLFPDRSRLSPAERRWPWLFAILGLLQTAHVGTPVPPRVGNAAGALVLVALLLACVLIATRRYRDADPVGRRRIKWVLFGAYCAAMPPIATALLSASNPAFLNVYILSLGAFAFLPLSLLIAIVRVNLFDVDRVLSTAGSYNLLIAIGVVIGVTVVPRAAEAGAALLGFGSRFGQLGLSGLLGLGIYYAHQRLRPRLEGLFFADRHALDVGVHDLIVRLRQATDVETLVREIGDSLNRLVRPESCVIYVRGDGAYVPLIAHGRTVPPALAVAGTLICVLHDRRQPLLINSDTSKAWKAIDGFHRAAFESLAAEVVVPIWRGNDIALLLFLGRKRSGDVYTPTDVRLLATMAETAALRLDHFAQSQVIAQMQQVRDTLRRYLSTPVADALGRGDLLDPAERDVTVLFVDLRGYTALCEPLPAQEAFELTSRYTAIVSEVLRRHHGNVVEFSGDGLMAIFGAPTPLANKEAAAVRAARELVTALNAHGPRAAGGEPLGVGIGIASGVAYCGNIRSADQIIWTAIGNIVNLASRLQALTREVDATIAIDQTTFSRAADAAADFELRDNVAIRGRRESQVVYVLPLMRGVAAA